MKRVISRRLQLSDNQTSKPKKTCEVPVRGRCTEEQEVNPMEPRVEDYTDSTCVASTAGAGALAMAP
ncbi:MAG: hypothetical protein HXS41_14955 [Theionarchaea archaeon]|nr:hypothetical protein [Theionarchaea archaeon]MBU6999443.1 hypothetical protein [Theionarchaea archaeon]MBU7022350.1 hypothetical protein [Theionarchaea archaeon]